MEDIIKPDSDTAIDAAGVPPIGDLAADIIATKSEARQETIDAIQSKSDTETPAQPVSTPGNGTGNGTIGGNAVGVDVGGNRFDPTIHETDHTTGLPRKTAAGLYRRKRGAGARVNRTDSVTTSTIPQIANAHYMAAVGMADCFFGAAQSMLGPDWKPSDDERNSIIHQGSRCCERYGITDFPPGVALVLALSAYAMNRQVTQAILGNVLNRWFGEKKQKPAEGEKDHPPHNNGTGSTRFNRV